MIKDKYHKVINGKVVAINLPITEKRADVRFWFNNKKGKPFIQPALGVKLDTREKMVQEVKDYCEKNNYILTLIEKITPRI